MGLYERLMGLEEPRIPTHDFTAMAGEYGRGKVTGVLASAPFGLSAAEKIEANTLVTRVLTGFLTAEEVTDVLMLAEKRISPYDTVAATKTRLGV